LLLNLSLVFICKDLRTTLFVVAAMLIFIGALLIAKRLESEYDSLPWQTINTRSDILRLLLLILPFFIPIIFYPFHMRIVFWNFNEMARVAFAWFIFSLIWLNLPKAKNNEIGIKGVVAPFLLFTFWAMVLWLDFIWDVGGREILSKGISTEECVKYDRLASVIYKIWETKPFSEHFGLAFCDYNKFKESAYSHHSQLYLLINYVVVKFIQLLINCKMEVATRLLPFFTSIMLTISVIFFFLKTKFNLHIRNISTQLTFFLGLGFLLSLPDFWITLLLWNTDNPFPWVSYITLVLFTYICVNEHMSRGFIFILYFYCLLSPFYALICLFTFCFFVYMPKALHKDKLPSRKIIIVLSIGLMLTAITLVYPKMIIRLLNYKDIGSSLLYRSGLDGDTSYYNNIWQAVTSPWSKYMIRPWSGLITTIVFCVIAFMLAGLRKYKKDTTELMNSIFLFSPYLFSIVVIPQSVSIHPYLYDYLLIFPLAFLGVYWLCSPEFQEKIKSLWLYLLFLFMSSFILHNLTKVAQMVRNTSF